MKILYLTATGNSLHIAKEIGGELLSIPGEFPLIWSTIFLPLQLLESTPAPWRSIYGEGIDNYLELKDSCTGCGICANARPVDNITVDREKKTISLSDNCFMCFACVHHCPSNAIHIKGEGSRADAVRH